MTKSKSKTRFIKTNREEQYQTRLAIIHLLKNGLSGKDTARQLGVSDGYVSRIKKDFQQNGYAALELYERGQPWGNETREMWEKEFPDHE